MHMYLWGADMGKGLKIEYFEGKTAKDLELVRKIPYNEKGNDG